MEKIDKVTVIGIAGGTGSGKTTVVKKLVEVLPPHYVAVVPLDSYYNDTSHMTEEERHQINFDHPSAFDWKLLHQQLADLRAGKAIEQPTYSYIKCNREQETIHVEPKPVVIIEGIMTLVDKKLRSLMDLKVFVDTDADERLIRNIQRDTIDRGRTVSMVVDRYLKVLKPMHEQFIEPTKRYADIANTQPLPAFTNVNLNMRAELTKNIALGFNVSNLFDTLQLTEGNPRAGSFISGDAGARYFLARPNFGRVIRASATVSF